MSLRDREGLVFRAVVYTGKLIVFLMIPGLHLVASGKGRLGWFFFTVAALSSTGIRVFPLAPDRFSFLLSMYLGLIIVLALLGSIIFVLADLRSLRLRPLFRPAYLAIIGAFLFYWPHPEPYVMTVEQGVQMCPTICFGDVTVSKKWYPAAAANTRLAEGDTVIYEFDSAVFSNYVLAGPGQSVCTNDKNKWILSDNSPATCVEKVTLGEDEYFVVGEDLSTPEGQTYLGDFMFTHSGKIHQAWIIGTLPVVVANWSEATLFLYRLSMSIYED